MSLKLVSSQFYFFTTIQDFLKLRDPENFQDFFFQFLCLKMFCPKQFSQFFSNYREFRDFRGI
jgi:hypothetical protein